MLTRGVRRKALGLKMAADKFFPDDAFNLPQLNIDALQRQVAVNSAQHQRQVDTLQQQLREVYVKHTSLMHEEVSNIVSRHQAAYYAEFHRTVSDHYLKNFEQEVSNANTQTRHIPHQPYCSTCGSHEAVVSNLALDSSVMHAVTVDRRLLEDALTGSDSEIGDDVNLDALSYDSGDELLVPAGSFLDGRSCDNVSCDDLSCDDAVTSLSYEESESEDSSVSTATLQQDLTDKEDKEDNSLPDESGDSAAAANVNPEYVVTACDSDPLVSIDKYEGGATVDKGGASEDEGGATGDKGGASGDEGGATGDKGEANNNKGGATGNKGRANDDEGGATGNKGRANDDEGGSTGSKFDIVAFVSDLLDNRIPYPFFKTESHMIRSLSPSLFSKAGYYYTPNQYVPVPSTYIPTTPNYEFRESSYVPEFARSDN